MNTFIEIGLLNLAERAHRKTIEILLTSSKVMRAVTQYQDYAARLKGASDTSVAVGLGLYYRVWYIGRGVPNSLRSNEYIYRNSKNLHLSDFGAMLNAQLSKLVEGVKITIVLDTNKIPADDFEDAAIVIMSVKPLRHAPAARDSSSLLAALNQARVFQHSAPFTREGSVHARSIDKQWKRVTLFEVREPFPYVVYRQPIISKTVSDLSPAEVTLPLTSIIYLSHLCLL